MMMENTQKNDPAVKRGRDTGLEALRSLSVLVGKFRVVLELFNKKRYQALYFV